MSDRYNYLTVFLEKDLKDEEAQPLMEAIKRFRGVLDVKPSVSDVNDVLAETRVRNELTQKLWHILHPEKA
jgi:hypothetical protein